MELRHLFYFVGEVDALLHVAGRGEELILVLALGRFQSLAGERHGGSYAQVAATFRFHGGIDDFVVFPCHAHLEAAARLQSAHVALFPCVGQGGKQIHETVVALQQHLGDAGGTSEVAVDLEWRVRVEEVRVGAALLLLVAHEGQLVADELEGVVAVEQARPQAHLPSHAPSCRRVAAVYQ